MAVVRSLVVAGIVAVGVQDVNAAVTLEVPTNYDTKIADIPAPFSKEEGYIFSSSVGNTQEREVVKHSSGYWPCLRVPKGLDERYPTWKTGGWMNSNKFCDFSKQPGKSMYSCRGMYTLYKTKGFPQFPAPHCFAYNLSFPYDKKFVSTIDDVQNQGDLCSHYIGKGRGVTPVELYKPVSDEWVAHRSTLGCPSDVWNLNQATKDTFCNQVTGIDWMHTCGYANSTTTRPVMHACWDVCSDTLGRCTLATKFGMGALLSSQNYEPKEYMSELNPYETIDAWCMFLSQDSVCLGMDYYYPDGKTTQNSCYPDGVDSKEVVKGLPADHPFAGTKGNFFRSDGKKMAEVAPKGASGGSGASGSGGAASGVNAVSMLFSIVAAVFAL
jgi:hypothetical protein